MKNSTILSLLAGAFCFPGSASAQLSFFDFSDPVITGAENTVGTTYLYGGADAAGLYDLKVTLTSITIPTPYYYTPEVLNPLDAAVITKVGGTYPDLFMPAWGLDNGALVTTYTPSRTFLFEVFQTGTSTPGFLDLTAITYDNDGNLSGGVVTGSTTVAVREQVTYSPGAVFTQIGLNETMEADGRTFTSNSYSIALGISRAEEFSITGVYSNVSSFSWTTAHITDDLAPNGTAADRNRLSSLSLGYAPVPEPSGAILLALTGSLALAHRRRHPAQQIGKEQLSQIQ